jgi:hypothetical protein
MRKIEYLSPTSLSLWIKSRDEFYVRYLADVRTPREPQTQPMSAGSAFDAYIKSCLYSTLIKGQDQRFELKTLFEAQVEKHNRDFAWKAGKELFELYTKTGSLADIVLELSDSVIEPRFELDVKGTISRTSEDNIPILGKPDIFWISSEGAHGLYDWKCNGFCAKTKISPIKGYVKMRDLSGHNTSHKDCRPIKYKGVLINSALTLDNVKEEWAMQLATYGWLCGEEIGSPFIGGIEQLLNNDRVASHRAMIPREYQETIYLQYKVAWKTIESGWIFRDLTKEESLKRQVAYDNVSSEDADFNSMLGGGRS